MGALMRATDWRKTPFGPVEDWPQSLRTAVSIMLESRFAMVVAWGSDFRFLYNDRYQPILGAKHPAALGKAGEEIFPEVWAVVGPEFERVRRGESFAIDDWYLPLERNGYPENCWFTLSYSPIRDETGGVGGLLAVVADTTVRVDSERRLATLRDLAHAAATVKTDVDACVSAAAILEGNQIDVPFAIFYLADAEGRQLRRIAMVGVDASHPAAASVLQIDGDLTWPFDAALTGGMLEVARDLDVHFDRPLPGGPYPEASTTAVALPLVRRGADRPYGLILAGVSPRRELDDAYRTFFTLASEHIATAIANARAFEEERTRAQQLAELDRAKTAFFSNVSHEFRTPLTLMLGPVEDILADADLASHHREALALTHRNGLRLRKLVNTLLDFSRIEAGRIEASFEPVDLATFTAELASVFRSAIDKAGLQYVVDCQAVGEPVYVDREMWEKVVLNLISNAFKFTLAGEIDIDVRRNGAHATVVVRDTGTGIPAGELPHIFERFRRVEGTPGRTHEGTGIGLALVQELVKLHGGSIDVDSTVGAGTSVSVHLPLGHAHLPPERLASARSSSSTAVGADAFVEEALRWLPDAPGDAATVERDDSRCVLVADDNADMRAYLRRLLGDRWAVAVVSNGEEALSFLGRRRPDLVIADVMMPKVDGFGLLREMRTAAGLRDIPVLMLSARAGDEARLEGLQAGADDYLVKPFAARELLTRVEAQLLRAEVRAIEESHTRRLTTIFQHAPVAIAILRGPHHVFESANDSYLEVAGRTAVVGQTIREVFPELEGQGIYELLDSVYSSGKPFMADSLRLKMRRRGPMRSRTCISSSSISRCLGLPVRSKGSRSSRRRSPSSRARAVKPRPRIGRRTNSWPCSATSCGTRLLPF